MPEEKNWGAEPWRAPKLADGDELIRSECGRSAFNIDYRSHWFTLVRGGYGYYYLLVSHGGGYERIKLPSVNFKHTVAVIAGLDSDIAYLMLHHLYDIARDARTLAEDLTSAKYRRAFADGTLKKRKVKHGVKVWIEPAASSVLTEVAVA